jgi:CRP-like cAMP-binding protein
MNHVDLSSAQYLAIKQALNHLVSPPDTELEQFLRLFSKRTLERGEYFLQAGDKSIELAFVNAGLLRFFTRLKKERNLIRALSQRINSQQPTAPF